jgi:hypothetical protein
LDHDPYTDAPIQTDRTHYEAQRIEGSGPSGVQMTIPMTFRNMTAKTVYFVGCRRPPMPILQKRVLGTWVTAWGGIELLCLSPPWEVAPGATRQDTLRLSGFWPGQNAGPEFLTDVPGRYRLLRAVHKAPDPLSPLIPEAARISNEFELTW